jgi:HK97 family phage prohead protease
MPAIRSKNWPLAPKEMGWDGDAAVERIRRWAGGPDKEELDWERYRSCFLWYDGENAENFTSYKFPYVDIVDGEPHVVFRALVAIIAILNGARGGTSISTDDKEAVYREAARQYRRFDEEPPELQRGWTGMDVEYRAFPAGIQMGDGARIIGYAAVFNTYSEPLGSFREIIRPGAFRNALEADVRALWNHDPNYVLGRTKNGTLTLAEDEKGLAVEIRPPDTQWARDVMESIRRGDVDQMSFSFRSVRERWLTDRDGQQVRELLEVELFDVSPVTFPAYQETTVQVRALLAGAGVDLAQLAGALSRARVGRMNDADVRVIKASSDALRQLIEDGMQGQRPGDPEGTAAQGRRRLLWKRIQLLEKMGG